MELAARPAALAAVAAMAKGTPSSQPIGLTSTEALALDALRREQDPEADPWSPQTSFAKNSGPSIPRLAVPPPSEGTSSTRGPVSSRSPLSARLKQAAGHAAKSTLAAPASVTRAIGSTISDALDEALFLVRSCPRTQQPPGQRTVANTHAHAYFTLALARSQVDGVEPTPPPMSRPTGEGWGAGKDAAWKKFQV